MQAILADYPWTKEYKSIQADVSDMNANLRRMGSQELEVSREAKKKTEEEATSIIFRCRALKAFSPVSFSFSFNIIFWLLGDPNANNTANLPLLFSQVFVTTVWHFEPYMVPLGLLMLFVYNISLSSPDKALIIQDPQVGVCVCVIFFSRSIWDFICGMQENENQARATFPRSRPLSSFEEHAGMPW